MIDRYEYPVILRLNADDYYDELKEKYEFYIDPRLPDYTVYTYDCIDPKYLQIYKNDGWKNLK